MDLMRRRREIMAQIPALQPIIMNGGDYNWTTGYYLGQKNNATVGKVTPSNYYKAVIDFIPCGMLANRSVSLSGTGVTSSLLVICAFYTDENEESYIGNSAIVTDNQPFTVPSNANYCRFCMGKNSDINGFILSTN